MIVTDADAHLHPEAVRNLVARIDDSPLIAAVAGAPHVTNRDRLICAMQVLEAASIIGLIRRTQSLTGRVGTVAGVFGIFRRDRVLAVGGYDPEMATEDIDLTWRLLMAGWQTAYEPRALIGMEVPSTLAALWAQRKRWARGQGEVLHRHLRDVYRPRNHRMWLLAFESVASLVWVITVGSSLVLAALGIVFGADPDLLGFGLVFGAAITVIATLQLAAALALSVHYDRWDLRSLLVGAIYPLLFWIASAAAALRSQVAALIRGPRAQRVVWDIPRDEQQRVVS
jgi:poly-beta-1,6-N-acetyl-D-glucosamine synthase